MWTKRTNPQVSQQLSYILYNLPTYIFAEWRFCVGSFCLVRHQEIDGISPEECTSDRYWKARVLEIRSNTSSSVSLENVKHRLAYLSLFQEYYLNVQWFYSKSDIQQVKPKGVKELDR
jgi:hypothetical protein